MTVSRYFKLYNKNYGMKKEMKDKINSLDPIVREKLLKRLAAERVAKTHNLEINFDEINQEDYVDEITKAKINEVKKLSELQKKAIVLNLKNSKPPKK
jgi:ABC-type branched-subunit amino acid transport system substrate-binding protein